MLRISSTEAQNNFGKLLMLAQEQDVIITRNGQDVARMTALQPKHDNSLLAESALVGGYGLRKATYEEFLDFTSNGEDRYEYIDGEIFLLASPKTDHQLALTELFGAFYRFFDGTECIPISARYDITIKRWAEDINVVQPDLMVICDLAEHLGDDGYYRGVPALVCEILSETSRLHDLVKKLSLYMDGGVREYWIADPLNKTVVVYSFEAGKIANHLTFKAPEHAHSVLFSELVVDLNRVFRALTK
jgi:prevent-host-death family protein